MKKMLAVIRLATRLMVSALVFTSCAALAKERASIEKSEASLGSNVQRGQSNEAAGLARELGIEFVQGSASTLRLKRGNKSYIVDVAARTVRELDPPEAPRDTARTAIFAANDQGAGSFQKNCATCHGADGKGLSSTKTPDFTDPKLQASLSDQQMIDIISNGKNGTAMPACATSCHRMRLRQSNATCAR